MKKFRLEERGEGIYRRYLVFATGRDGVERELENVNGFEVQQQLGGLFTVVLTFIADDVDLSALSDGGGVRVGKNEGSQRPKKRAH